jgi:hypothetical protein
MASADWQIPVLQSEPYDGIVASGRGSFGLIELEGMTLPPVPRRGVWT